MLYKIGDFTNMSATFSVEGYLVISGNTYTANYINEVVKALPESKTKTYLLENIAEFGIAEVLAIKRIFSTAIRFSDPEPTSSWFVMIYRIGALKVTDDNIVSILKWILEGDSWNAAVGKMFSEPVRERAVFRFTHELSPYLVGGKYYDQYADRDIFFYSISNGIIVYINGLVIWTKTGHTYKHATRSTGGNLNGDDNYTHVYFKDRSVLDVIARTITTQSGIQTKLEFGEIPGEIKTVTNVSNTKQNLTLYQRVLSDTHTQLSILGILIVFLIIKSIYVK